jgi:hypothetical protein
MEHLDFGSLDHNTCCYDQGNSLDEHCLHQLEGYGLEPTTELHSQPNHGLSQQLTVAYVAQGMDPSQAALQAQLEAPLLEPYLF